jgi:hypothetical protein
MVLGSLPEESVEKKVLICYMENYSEWDIRLELKITKKALGESREKIRQLLLDTAEKIHGECQE